MAVKYHSYPDGYIAPPLHVLQKSGLASNRNLCYTNLNMATVVSSCNLNFAFVRFPLLFGFVDCCVALDYRAGLNFLTRKFFTIFRIFLQNLRPTYNILFSHVRETDISFCFLPLSASVRDRGSPQTVHRAGWKFSTRNFLTILNFFFCPRRGGTCPEPIPIVDILLGSPV